jgi:hypothetical protein
VSGVAGARDRAVAFVEAFGDGFSTWRAAALVAGRPVQECPLPDGVAQRPDGSFAAPDSPGAEPALGALLRVIGALDDLRALHLPVAERACAHLAATQADDGSWGPANVPHEAGDAVLQWTGREFERGLRTGRFDAVQTGRVLLYADSPALPGGRVDAAEVVDRILTEQAGDGGWLRPEDPAPEARVAHTLDALAALVRFA